MMLLLGLGSCHLLAIITHRKPSSRVSVAVLDLNARSTKRGTRGTSSSWSLVVSFSMMQPGGSFPINTSIFHQTGRLRGVRRSESATELSLSCEENRLLLPSTITERPWSLLAPRGDKVCLTSFGADRDGRVVADVPCRGRSSSSLAGSMDGDIGYTAL